MPSRCGFFLPRNTTRLKLCLLPQKEAGWDRRGGKPGTPFFRCKLAVTLQGVYIYIYCIYIFTWVRTWSKISSTLRLIDMEPENDLNLKGKSSSQPPFLGSSRSFSRVYMSKRNRWGWSDFWLTDWGECGWFKAWSWFIHYHQCSDTLHSYIAFIDVW